jgi:hypothetical protein
MSKNTIIALLVIGILVLVGCSTADVEKADSIEDIVGLWQTTSIGQGPTWYLLYLEDGTIHGSTNLDLIDDRPVFAADARFEGTKLFMEETLGVCEENPTGIYEVELLENGNRTFTAIEDECARRVSFNEGARGDEEWEPVP